MAKRDPVRALKRFVDRLKKEKPEDFRRPRPSAPPSKRPRSEYSRRRPCLVCKWQVWEYLLMDRQEPCRGRDDFHHFAPPHWVDENTLMITTPSAFFGGWCVRLIWPVGEDYCVRVLTDEEMATISNLSHLAIRQTLGFTARQPK
jgi:hypothetical protein